MKFCLSLLFVPIFASAQFSGIAYHKVCFKLDSLLLIAKDSSLYLKEFEQLPFDSLMENEYFTSCKIYSRKKQYDKFLLSAGKCFELGQTATTVIDFNHRLPAVEKSKLLDLELEMKKKYFSNVSIELYDEIRNLAEVDSKFRDLHARKIVTYDIIRLIDSVSLSSLRRLIDKHGTITEKKHGALFNQFFYLIIHCAMYRYEDHEWMRKLLYKEVQNGSVRPDLYAYFVDRFEVANKRPQKYGAMIGTIPVTDWKQVNKNRSEIGTCDLWNWKLMRTGRF